MFVDARYYIHKCNTPLGDLKGRCEGSKFFQFHAVFGNFGKIVCWRPRLGGWRPHPGKSWIHHCRLCSSMSSRSRTSVREGKNKNTAGTDPGFCILWAPTYDFVKISKQECIPVRCVPSAAVAVPGGLHQASPWSRHPPEQAPPQSRHPPPPEQTPPEQAPPAGWSCDLQGKLGYPPPWTEFLTHASENITLSQTSFAGGKKKIDKSFVRIMHWPIPKEGCQYLVFGHFLERKRN